MCKASLAQVQSSFLVNSGQYFFFFFFNNSSVVNQEITRTIFQSWFLCILRKCRPFPFHFKSFFFISVRICAWLLAFLLSVLFLSFVRERLFCPLFLGLKKSLIIDSTFPSLILKWLSFVFPFAYFIEVTTISPNLILVFCNEDSDMQ